MEIRPSLQAAPISYFESPNPGCGQEAQGWRVREVAGLAPAVGHGSLTAQVALRFGWSGTPGRRLGQRNESPTPLAF